MTDDAPGAVSSASMEVHEIRSRSGWQRLDLGEAWRNRELLRFLAWRELKVRYAQTFIGIAWTVLQPIATLALFVVVFGRLARVPSDGAPYALLALTGLTIWSYTAAVILSCGESLITNKALVTKVYMPRLLIPLAPVIAHLLDLAIMLLLLAGVLLIFGMVPTVAALATPVILLPMLLFTSGAGCALAALNLRYRDFRQAIPFILQFGMFASPVAYPVSMIPAEYRLLYALNPLVGTIDRLRAALLGTPADDAIFLVSLAAGAVTFIGGVAIFRRNERIFADLA
jgi:lipopolysaccharide transport system permease protein